MTNKIYDNQHFKDSLAFFYDAVDVKFHRPCPECQDADIPLLTFAKRGEPTQARYWWCPKHGVFGMLNDKPLFWETRGELAGDAEN